MLFEFDSLAETKSKPETYRCRRCRRQCGQPNDPGRDDRCRFYRH